MKTITANKVKNRGVSLIEKLIREHNEVVISYRGKPKFVVLSVEEYERLKEADLESAIKQAEEEYRQGKFVKESAEEHFKKLGI